MTDGLDRLRKLNRTSPEELEPLVAMDRDELFELLEEDAGSRPRLALVSRRMGRSTTRAGYVGATVVAAAAVVAVVLVTGRDVTTDSDLNPAAEAEPADSATTVDEPLIVDTPADPDETPTTVAGDIAEVGEAAVAEGSTVETAPPTTEPAPTTTEAPAGPDIPVMDGPFTASTDLLVLHYDHAHRDDGQATTAALEMTTAYDLTPLVVAGTSRGVNDTDPIPPFEQVMEAAWGDEWFNALADRQRSVNESADRWLTAIDQGGVIWVAEGGASDFTAEVLRQIKDRRPNLDTAAQVQVVQHSAFNETHTAAGDLDYVKANSTYVRLEDGNSDNSTANLNQASAGFTTAALAGQNGEAWAAAFEYLPASRLDFSDLVEVLHILGIGTDEVATPDDFADRFIG